MSLWKKKHLPSTRRTVCRYASVLRCLQGQVWHWPWPGVYLRDLIQPYHQGRDLRSASHDLLNIPFTKSTAICSRSTEPLV